MIGIRFRRATDDLKVLVANLVQLYRDAATGDLTFDGEQHLRAFTA